MTSNDLITRIEACAERHRLAPATVTARAVGNSRLYARLKAGKSCTLAVAERIIAFANGLDAAAAKTKGAA